MAALDIQVVVALKTSQSSITALHHLYQNMGGDSWNHAAINSTLPGRVWDFNGWQVTPDTFLYLVDPCMPDDEQVQEEMQSFMGLRCACTATSCHVTKIHISHDFSASRLVSSVAKSDRDRVRDLDYDYSSSIIRRVRPVGISDRDASTMSSNTVTVTSNTALEGSLPDSICSLTELSFLYMEAVTGTIPSCIGQMAGLEFVQMSQSGLSGTLPESLCQLQNLDVLEMSHNKLRGTLPSCLGDLKNLSVLYLGANQLTSSIPASLAGMTNLWKLSLAQNQLDGTIPPALGTMSSVMFLDLSGNKLKGNVPSELGDLADIYYIGLSNNLLSGTLPDAFDRLDSLKYVEIRGNQLTGGFPECFLKASALQALDLTHNLLQGSLPSALGKMTQMTLLSLNDNKFYGELPKEFGKLVNLKNFLIGNNEISGQMPEELGDMASLEKLHLMFNKIDGTIPASLSKLTNMNDFKIFKNKIEGSLPPSLRNWAKLQYFQIGGNAIEGSMDIFDSTTMTSLEVIDLGGNVITGQLPMDIFRLPKIKTFAAPLNCLSGFLPRCICDAVTLEHLILSSLTSGKGCREYFVSANSTTFTGFQAPENMDGVLPACLYNLPKLRTLYAAGNSFLGQLPAEISPDLLELDVSGNRLNGDLPDSFATSNLEILYINNNRLSGTLDKFQDRNSTLIASSKSFVLNATVNRLSGTIPSKFYDIAVNQLAILNGNTFQCDAQNPLPLNDPDTDQYLCGSSQFNLLFGLIVFVVVSFIALVISLWYFSYRKGKDHWVYKFVRRARYWYAVGRHTNGGHAYKITVKNVLNKKYGKDQREVQLYHTLRYSEYWESLRSIMIKTSYVMIGMLALYLSMTSKKYRSINFTYLWASTCAYLSGNESVYLLTSFWIMALFCIRFYIKQDKEKFEKFKRKHSMEKNHSERAESLRQIQSPIQEEADRLDLLVPTLRILAIMSLSVSIVSVANVMYLFVLLNYSANAIAAASLALTVFKLAWDYYILPVIFVLKPFMFGIDEKHHNKFIDTYLGGKLNVLFITNVFLNFFVPIFCIVFADPACFNGVIRAANEVKTTYSVPECTDWLVFTGGCTDEVQTDITVKIIAPFVYNHTCASSILKAFVPIYMSMQVVIGAKVFMYIFSLMYETREANEYEKEAIEEYRESRVSKYTDVIPSEVKNDLKTDLVTSEVEARFAAATETKETEEDDKKRTKKEESNSKGILSCFSKSKEEIQKELVREKAVAKFKNEHDHSIRRQIMDLINSLAPGGQLLMVRHASRILFYLNYGAEMVVDKDSQWLEIIVTIHMGNLVILFTYGILAPLLGLSIIIVIILESFTAQIILGRFIAQQSDVLSYAKNPETLYSAYNLEAKDNCVAETDEYSSRTVDVLPSVFTKALTEAVDDYDEPYGSITVLQESEIQLAMLPTFGIMYMGRRLFLISAGVVFALTINDVYFNLPDAKISYVSQLLVLLALPIYDLLMSFGKSVAVKFYPDHFAYLTRKSEDNESVTESNTSINAMTSRNPLHDTL